MNINYQQEIPAGFHDSSRVWIYQSSRLFTLQELFAIEDKLKHFVSNWKTHGTPVKGYANVFFGYFIVIIADETAAGVSGCSTDSSVHVIKEIETEFNVQLFNRQMLAFIRNDKIELLPFAQCSYALEHKHISADTLYFNNLVETKKDFLESWIVPVKQSWLATKLAGAIAK